MNIFTSVLFLSVTVAFLFTSAGARAIECPPCGPTYCVDDPDYPAKLSDKKRRMRNETPDVPQTYIDLIERQGKCLRCVETSPDVPGLTLVYTNGDNLKIAWTQNDEDIARQKLLSGDYKEHFVSVGSRYCHCCQETQAEGRPDYRADIDLNTDIAIRCAATNGQIVCQ